jgi:hypothetical protein
VERQTFFLTTTLGPMLMEATNGTSFDSLHVAGTLLHDRQSLINTCGTLQRVSITQEDSSEGEFYGALTFQDDEKAKCVADDTALMSRARVPS